MKRIFLLLLLWLFPVCSWACTAYANGGDVTIANLPPKVLLSAGNYTAGTILYDSGKITTGRTALNNCTSKIYAQFQWASGMAGSQISDQIYTTSVPGIGIRIKVWLNITGQFDGYVSNFTPDYSEHHIGDADFLIGQSGILWNTYSHTYYTPAYQLQLIATGGKIANSSTITLGNPTSTVSIKDGDGTMAASSLRVTGSTQIQLVPMGCTADVTSLTFKMGNVSASAFNDAATAGSAQQTVGLSCQPGTNVTMTVSAALAEGDNPDNSVIALKSGTKTATGVGVQLKMNGEVLTLNQSTPIRFSSRTPVLNDGADGGYIVFADPNNPGGATSRESFTFSASYYKTASEVTGGEANASGTITFAYN